MEYVDDLKEMVLNGNHAFLIDDDKVRRKEYLKSIADETLLEPNSDKPFAIYLDYKDLARTAACDNWMMWYIEVINKRYFGLCMLERLIAMYVDCLNRHAEIKELNIKEINFDFINGKYQVKSVLEYLDIIREEKAMIYRKYHYFAQSDSIVKPSVIESPVCYTNFEKIICYIKSVLNNSGNAVFIIDEQDEFSINLMQRINTYISDSQSYAIKIGCGKNDWKTYENNERRSIEPHTEYRIVEMPMYLKRNR